MRMSVWALVVVALTCQAVQGVPYEEYPSIERTAVTSRFREDHPHDDLQAAFMNQDGSQDSFAFVRGDVLPNPEHISNGPSLTFSKEGDSTFITEAQGSLPSADKIDGIIVKILEGSSPMKIAENADMISTGKLGELRWYYVFKRKNKADTWPQIMARLKQNPAVLFATVDLEQRMVEAGTVEERDEAEDATTAQVTVVKATSEDGDSVAPKSKAEVAKEPKFEVPKASGFHLQWHLVNPGTKKGQIRGEDANVYPAWRSGISGKGILVSVADIGVQSIHPDFRDRYKAKWAYDFGRDVPGGDPLDSNKEVHGTACAGVIAASKDGSCSVGASFAADLTSFRILGKGMDTGKLAKALTHGLGEVDIHSHSWTYGGQDGSSLVKMSPAVQAAYVKGAKEGRDGRGAIYVMAAGNNHKKGGSPDHDGIRSLRHVIAVGASDWAGKVSQYSERGATVFIVAPSSNVLWAKNGEGIFTSDPVGSDGKSKGDCRNNFGGTSSATPLVSGVIALMLESNPGLTARDVQEILARTSRRNDLTDKGWSFNMAGYHINEKYGFGRVDAAAAVDLARQWIPLPEEKTIVATAAIRAVVAPVGGGVTVGQRVGHSIVVEHVNVFVDITVPVRGKIAMMLISPSGTKSLIFKPHRDTGRDIRWTFRTVRCRGERSDGTWKLVVQNSRDGSPIRVNKFHVYIHGRFARDAFERGVLKSMPLTGKFGVLFKTGKNIMFGKKTHKLKVRGQVGIESYSYEADKESNDPTWNKFALYNIKLTNHRTLKIKVFAGDAVVGTAHIPLVSYFARPNVAIPVKVRLGGGTMFGEIEVILKFSPSPPPLPVRRLPYRTYGRTLRPGY